MNILAIETSTMLGGIAIADENRLISEARLNVKATHSERLMEVIDSQLRQASMGLGDIDMFAVASGPGSFTGLRIGLSTAKGLCYATGKPLVMVPTLEAYARMFSHSEHPVCLMLDARRSEVYAAVFRVRDLTPVRLLAEISTLPENLFKEIQGTVLLAGEGAQIYRNRLAGILGHRALFASPEKMVPSPAAVAMLGIEKAQKGEFADPASAAPFYVRRSEAEVKWDEKH